MRRCAEIIAAGLLLAGCASKPPPAPDPALTNYKGLKPEEITNVVRNHTGDLRFCYRQALRAKPQIEGKVVLAFTILPNGKLAKAHVRASTLGMPDVDQCVLDAFESWEFPASVGGGPTEVVGYPVYLSPG